MKTLALRSIGLALAAVGFVACQNTAPDIEPAANTLTPAGSELHATAPAVVAAPMELDDGQRSAWNYLAAKYDADGDGRVTGEEHGVAGGRDNFEQLDRDGDGVLTADDYASSGTSMEAQMTDMRTQATLFAYFQADEDVTSLEREELSWSFSEYDEDLDGVVTEEEFLLLAEAKQIEIPSEMGLGRSMTGDYEPWTALIAGLDQDTDLTLASAEIEGFFDERSVDGSWKLQSQVRPAGADTGPSEPASGAKVGTLAPDFSLSPPEGGEVVQLSSFRGKQPVALIFGSYT